MKKITALLIAQSLFLAAQAQIVSETVDFDTYLNATDNDFENRFDNGTGLVQIQTGGITGGCLQTPQTISWGNDNAIYCTRFKGVTGTTYITGICFKYDTLQLNNINFDRPASLWMKPAADPNHYIIASVLDTRRIQIVSYSATSTSGVLQLQQGHWYNLLLISDFTGGAFNDQIDINAQVNDLGITGTDPPFPTGFTNTVLHDSVMIADTAIEVSLTGTLWGGALYLDNFRFDGMKSFDNCISTDLAEAAAAHIEIIQNETTLSVISGGSLNGVISLCDIQGKQILAIKTGRGKTIISTTGLSAGVYFLRLRSAKSEWVKKIFLNK